MKILVIDDEPECRQILREWLCKRGFDVWEATGGLETLTLLNAGQHDVVLLDLGMTQGDGLSLIPRIREISPKSKIVSLEKPIDFQLLNDQLKLASGTDRPAPVPSLGLRCDVSGAAG